MKNSTKQQVAILDNKTYLVERDQHNSIIWRDYETNQISCHDGPAVEDADGTKEWWINGERHREDGPAIEYTDGTKEWYLNGKRHRENGPAIECADGSKSWWLNGKRHREDGPAIEWADGIKYWYIEGCITSAGAIQKLSKNKLKKTKQWKRPAALIVILFSVSILNIILFGTIMKFIKYLVMMVQR